MTCFVIVDEFRWGSGENQYIHIAFSTLLTAGAAKDNSVIYASSRSI
jgi:hypothetical protein